MQGALAVEVTHHVADPARGLRDRLGLLVDHLERHVSTSTGPTPYPWRSLQSLRQDLAAAYLEATQLARRLDELERAVADDAVTMFDLATAVELGLRIASHHLGPVLTPPIELLVDLGNAPPVRGVAGTVALAIAQLVGVCARSARARENSSLSVRVRTEDGAGLVSVVDNGGGDPGFDSVGELVRDVLAPWGVTVGAASAPAQGCAFELRFAS
jgi:hypothetical protein